MERKPQYLPGYAVTVELYPVVLLDTLETTVQRRRQDGSRVAKE
ncbi:MAG: hypothetical protein PHI12_02470 [Dehalococcoidales bacterium]|nr:hypothetical protein [Dehalococcoidales bacterium]